jgi:predicted nucleotidyltransferase
LKRHRWSMSNSLLDFSHQPELAVYARVIADVEAAAVSIGAVTLIVGAFARDLHLLYRHNIATSRETEDVDIALAMPDWKSFETLRARLIESGNFRTSGGALQRLRHRTDLPLDLLPFGPLETADRTIVWPPGGDVVMDVLGFQEALAYAHQVVLPENIHARLTSLPALALLKIVCWHDRHYSYPGKDAYDLNLIIRNYLIANKEERLWHEFATWTQEEDFDFERAGARMLGHDIRSMLDRTGIQRIAAILSEQSDQEIPGLLPSEMSVHEPERPRALLEAMLHEIRKIPR